MCITTICWVRNSGLDPTRSRTPETFQSQQVQIQILKTKSRQPPLPKARSADWTPVRLVFNTESPSRLELLPKARSPHTEYARPVSRRQESRLVTRLASQSQESRVQTGRATSSPDISLFREAMSSDCQSSSKQSGLDSIPKAAPRLDSRRPDGQISDKRVLTLDWTCAF